VSQFGWTQHLSTLSERSTENEVVPHAARQDDWSADEFGEVAPKFRVSLVSEFERRAEVNRRDNKVR
jgi:hypothetical protein